jgi:hypothetical protein
LLFGLLAACGKEDASPPLIEWEKPLGDLQLSNAVTLEAAVKISDNKGEIKALLSLSNQDGYVFFSKNVQSGKREKSISINEQISISDLLPGTYRLSLLATDQDDNRIRSTRNIEIENSNAPFPQGGWVSLHQNGNQAYLSYLLNGQFIRSIPTFAENALLCADPAGALALIAPQGAGDLRCFEPTEATLLWSKPGTTGTLGGFTCCTATATDFLVGEKTGFIRKYSRTGLAQGSYSYQPGAYYPSEVFVFQNRVYSLQNPLNTANPQKMVVFDANTSVGIQELNLSFKVSDAVQKNDTVYLLSESNPRQIWRYLATFNSYELAASSAVSVNKAFLEPFHNGKLLLSCSTGVYLVDPSLNWTQSILSSGPANIPAKSTNNPEQIMLLENNLMKIFNVNGGNLISETTVDVNATGFILLN